jgi:tetratricopeptide (TPR) repeat protein
MKRWTGAAMPHLSPTTPKSRAGWVLYWVSRHQAVFGVRELSDVRRRMIELFREAGDVVGLSCALRTAGIALARPGEASGDALDMLQEAVSLLRPTGRSKDLANALAHLGSFHHFNGDDALAQRLSEEALEMRQVIGDQTGQLVSYLNLAEFAFVRGETDLAIEYATKALAPARNQAVQEVLGAALSNLSNYRLSINDLAGAYAAATEALALHLALGNEDYAVVCLEHLALAKALAREPLVAARLYGYTEAFFKRTQQVRDRSEQIGCDRLRGAVVAMLTPQELEAAMKDGAAWNQTNALAAAGHMSVTAPEQSGVAMVLPAC